MLPEEIQDAAGEGGGRAFRGKQIFKWISRGVFDFSEMTDIPLRQREYLSANHLVCSTSPQKVLKDSDGTMKMQTALSDGAAVEAVLLSDSAGRKTACVSCQVGCPMGCAFCKTGSMGFSRNLTAGEITEQFLHLEKQAGTLDNVVFMGMGEPLLNLGAVRKAIAILTSPAGRNISHRRMTLSTAGVCEGIYDLADNGPEVRLAVSLTTADPVLRAKLMPVENANPLPELKKALKYFCEKTGKRVTLEAVLLRGINMSADHAKRMRDFCRGLRANINLIPWNPAEGLSFSRPTYTETNAFAEMVRATGITTIVRHPRGKNISGACGQLGKPASREPR